MPRRPFPSNGPLPSRRLDGKGPFLAETGCFEKRCRQAARHRRQRLQARSEDSFRAGGGGRFCRLCGASMEVSRRPVFAFRGCYSGSSDFPGGDEGEALAQAVKGSCSTPKQRNFPFLVFVRHPLLRQRPFSKHPLVILSLLGSLFEKTIARKGGVCPLLFRAIFYILAFFFSAIGLSAENLKSKKALLPYSSRLRSFFAAM